MTADSTDSHLPSRHAIDHGIQFGPNTGRHTHRTRLAGTVKNATAQREALPTRSKSQDRISRFSTVRTHRRSMRVLRPTLLMQLKNSPAPIRCEQNDRHNRDTRQAITAPHGSSLGRDNSLSHSQRLAFDYHSIAQNQFQPTRWSQLLGDAIAKTPNAVS